jgi:hypothetical protein
VVLLFAAQNRSSEFFNERNGRSLKRILVPLLLFVTACSESTPGPGTPDSPVRAATERPLVGATAAPADKGLPVQLASDAGPAADWSVAHALARAPRCGVDEIVHRIQGQPVVGPGVSVVTCPELPAQLDPAFGIAPSALFFFDLSAEHDAEAARKGYPGFVLEGSMPDIGPPDSPRVQCVYVGCTRLQTAAEGVPTSGRESCLGPLTGGTAYPSSQAADCPAAVKIAGAYRPFTRKRMDGAPGKGSPADCCYSIPAPVPP